MLEEHLRERDKAFPLFSIITSTVSASGKLLKPWADQKSTSPACPDSASDVSSSRYPWREEVLHELAFLAQTATLSGILGVLANVWLGFGGCHAPGETRNEDQRLLAPR